MPDFTGISPNRFNANAFIEEAAPTSVPETASILGLLGVASLGALVSKGKKQA
ncbi:hypothetical protein [Cyanothece sp. BG0011]|uniref:hypothetical protein n=1 Tax=Cyanothece sp. BG0011 TaxID=2082950 RepID=UPI00130084B5